MQIEPDDNDVIVDDEVILEEGEIITEDVIDSEDDELVITLEGEAPPEDAIVEEEKVAPQWVKDLRKRQKELERENRELKASQAAAAKNAAVSAPALPEKPKLSDPDIDFDSDIFEERLDAWKEKKREIDAITAKEAEEFEKSQAEWVDKVSSYNKAKAEIKVRDFDESEYAIQSALNPTQQGIILQGSDNPAHLIYALGKNAAKLKEIADIKDPVKYAWALAKLEAKMSVTTRKAPAPETKVSGTARVSGSVDSTLDRLRAEAEKTGDYTKVMQYKKNKK